MARRRKKRRGKGKTSIAVLPVIAGVMPAYRAYEGAGGINKDLPKWMLYCYTGYNSGSKTWESDTAFAAAVPFIGAVVAHKLANKAGLNKHIRKATMGYLSL